MESSDGHLPPGGGRPQPDGAALGVAPAGRMRNAPSADDEMNAHAQEAVVASSSSAIASASASPADSEAATATLAAAADGGPISVPQSAAAVASISPQQPAPASAPSPAAATVAAADSAPTSAADAAADASMLRCMTECRDVQFALMELLQLEDLAALNVTCHSWRQWLLSPPLIGGLHFGFVGSAEKVILLSQSDWARQLVTDVRLHTWPKGDAHFLLRRDVPAAADTELVVCDQLLSALARFTRLHTLKPTLCDVFAVTSLWPTCLTALSGSLRVLTVAGLEAAPVNSILAHVNKLRHLTTLTIFVGVDVAREVDLSQLPSLPHLRRFTLFARDEEGETIWFRCTPQQVQHLARCSRLTHVDCGSWSPDERELDDDGWQLPPIDQQIEAGIATLVRGLPLQSAAAASAAGAAESASSSSAALPISTAAPSRLQSLNLMGTVMSAAVWEHVSRLTELAVLFPFYWRNDMTPQLWARLADFKRLQVIHFQTHPDEDDSPAPLRTDHFLPPLLQCTQLCTVVMMSSQLSLSAAQLDAIAGLPLLRSLNLRDVEVESAAPLVRATKLGQLRLSFCRGPPAVVDFRRSLPPMPALTELLLQDRDRITADQAAPLNATLFARMPKLTAANFKQNLLKLA